MKKILLVLALALGSQLAIAGESKETRKVCVTVKKDGKDVIDPKTKKPKESCKQVKQHKKLEGHEVPVKK